MGIYIRPDLMKYRCQHIRFVIETLLYSGPIYTNTLLEDQGTHLTDIALSTITILVNLTDSTFHVLFHSHLDKVLFLDEAAWTSASPKELDS